MKLHLFNPENDLALAANAISYTAPRAAQQMSRSGAALPLWYGDAGDRAICAVNSRWYEDMRDDFGLDVAPWDHNAECALEPSPWGWSTAARHRFEEAGVPAAWLPDDGSLRAMRDLSHRRTGARLARFVIDRLGTDGLTGSAVEARDPQQLEDVLARLGGDVYIKQPWSSSGRGVISTHAGVAKAVRFALESIAKQGSVMVEPAHERALDFAFIYECRHAECRFVSTSVFANDEHGSYMSNVLAAEDVRRSLVAALCGNSLLESVREVLRQGIEAIIAPSYTGIVGVDMLVTRQGLIDPVVEVNLRKTMGYVANRFADRYLAEGARGTFTVHRAQKRKPAAYRAVGNRLVEGVLHLTPAGGDFEFVVTVCEI